MTTSSRTLTTSSSSAHALPLARRAVLLGGTAALALAALAFTGAASVLAADSSADDFIQRVGNQTVTILKDGSLSDQQKVARLKQVLNQSTDLPYIARVVMGRYWRQATEQQRQEYLRLFDALVIQAMAERIGSYAGQTFDITSSQKVDERDTMVSTIISAPAGPQYRVDWRVRRSEDDGFDIIDIVAEGVSLVITQRSEVNDIVGRNGIDGLLAEMGRRIEQRNVTGNLPRT